MSSDNAKTSGNSQVAATPSKQTIERNPNGVPAPAATGSTPVDGGV